LSVLSISSSSKTWVEMRRRRAQEDRCDVSQLVGCLVEGVIGISRNNIKIMFENCLVYLA